MRSQAVGARLPYGDRAARPGRADTGFPAGVRAGAAHLLPVGATRPLRFLLRLERVNQSAPLLAALAAACRAQPVRVRGTAMASRLLADGPGPLYREACRNDLDAIIERATHALTR